MVGNETSIQWLDAKTVKVAGSIDEFFEYDKLFDNIPDEVWIDMSGIQRINSCGVREWVRRIMSGESKVHYTNCPSLVVDQISIVPQFLGLSGVIDTFYGSFICDECGEEKDELFKVGEDIFAGQDMYEEPDEIDYPNCNSKMGFAHNPHIFFSFLSHKRSVG